MLNAEQKKAFDLMKSGANVHLYGEAGTGKSYVVKEFLNSLSEDERVKTLITAPTGIAALNIGGVTLHRTFKAPREPISPHNIPAPVALDVIKNADRIIIDEISMCRFDLFEFISKCIRLAEESKKRIQVIVIGDFLQLPPVITSKDRVALNELWEKKDIGNGYAFQAPLWKSYKFKNVGLKTIVRQQEKELAENENKARKGDTSCIRWFKKNTSKCMIENAITLVAKNSEADTINNREINKLTGRCNIFEAKITGTVEKSEYPTSKNLKIYKNMRVMLIVNNSEHDLKNGEIGTVLDINSHSVVVSFDNGTIAEIENNTFEFYTYEVKKDKKGRKYIEKTCVGSFTQLPLKPAYAITIHKSQGQTYDSVNLKAGSCFAAGQLYVGLSRCKTAKNLYIDRISDKNLITSQEALDFYSSLNKAEKAQPVVKNKDKKQGRGGAREGAGRKNKYVSKTIIMRVPEVAKAEIEELCKKYIV